MHVWLGFCCTYTALTTRGHHGDRCQIVSTNLFLGLKSLCLLCGLRVLHLLVLFLLEPMNEVTDDHQ